MLSTQPPKLLELLAIGLDSQICNPLVRGFGIHRGRWAKGGDPEKKCHRSPPENRNII